MDLMNAVEKEQVFGGSKRGGKTVGGSQKAAMVSMTFPGNRGYILRQNLTDLRESTLETFFKIVPADLILDHHQTHRKILIKTSGVPSTIIYSGLSDESDEESSKGKEAGWLWIDEPSEIKLKTYLMYLSQLCWELPPCKCKFMDKVSLKCQMHPLNGGFPPFMAWLTTNPESGWVEDRFRPLIEAASETKPVVRGDNQIFIRSLPRDNVYLPPNWESDLRKNAPESFVIKYLNGVWGAVEGQVFKEFDKDTHGIKKLSDIPKEYLASLKLIGCLDHATTGITCFAINGIDPHGNIISLASHYQEDRAVNVHAQAVKMLLDRICKLCSKPIDGYKGKNFGQYPALDFFEYVLIDPSTQAKTQTTGNELWSIQDLYWREGIPTLAAHNAITAGVDLMKQYIHPKPTHVHPFKLTADGKQVFGAPSWFVVLEENIEGVRELIGWKTTKNDKDELKYVGRDHWIDDQRYIIMSRPEPPQFTNNDLLAMDVHGRQAQKALSAFDKKFGHPETPGQWFPGGSGSSSTWFPERIN